MAVLSFRLALAPLAVAGVLLSANAVPAFAAGPAAAQPSAPAAAKNLSPEERLDAIRQGLLKAALEGATRVESVAWLDAQGRLHESSSFRSGMQVRGVQVLAYVRDREGQAQAKLALPPAEAARRDLVKDALPSVAQPSCGSSQGLRHLVALESAVAGSWNAQDAPMAHALLALAGEGLSNEGLAAGGQGSKPRPWRMLPQAPAVQRSAYEQAMLGHSTVLLPWQAQLQVQPGPPPAVRPGPAFLHSLLGDAPAASARITLRLQARGQTSALAPLTLSADVALQREASNWGAPQFSPAGRAQVQALLQTWAQALSTHLACEVVRPEVSAGAGGQLRINAGALAGVRAGEEWLLADPQAFPGRLLAPGVLQQLVLAKVQTVRAHDADLQLLAGPAQPIQPGWRAWRAESPLGE